MYRGVRGGTASQCHSVVVLSCLGITAGLVGRFGVFCRCVCE